MLNSSNIEREQAMSNLSSQLKNLFAYKPVIEEIEKQFNINKKTRLVKSVYDNRKYNIEYHFGDDQCVDFIISRCVGGEKISITISEKFIYMMNFTEDDFRSRFNESWALYRDDDYFSLQDGVNLIVQRVLSLIDKHF